MAQEGQTIITEASPALPPTRLKMLKWGDHFRRSAEMTLNTNPATMGLQDQVKMLTGYDRLTFKKISTLERKTIRQIKEYP